ncbi:hypothetical protein [Streptomyces sp. NPDC013455]|uniref:hypothetical protein n=1 Tax=Streptomyces sp. NPDC013455 TaxID=3155605 RepID=UPI0033EBA293
MRRFGAPLTGLVLALLMVGCSPREAAGPPPAESDPRPLSGVLTTSATGTTRLRAAEERAVAACMARRGFAYEPERTAADARAATTNPYGLLREETTRQDGYGAVGAVLGTPPATRRASGAPGHPRKWSDALLGTRERKLRLAGGRVLVYRPDGCAHQARERAYGKGWDALQGRLEALQATVMDEVAKDSGYRTALTAWSACMADSGHAYTDLQAPREEIGAAIRRARGSADRLRDVGREELETAWTDYSCERTARLHEAVSEAQRRVEGRLLDGGDRQAVRQYRRLKQAALARHPGT